MQDSQPLAAGAKLRRPVEKGFVVDWGLQDDILDLDALCHTLCHARSAPPQPPPPLPPPACPTLGCS